MWITALWNKFKQFIRDIQIRYKLLLAFLVLVLVPVLLITMLSFQSYRNVIQKKTEEYIMDVLNEVNKNIDLDFQGLNHIYFTIFTNETVQSELRLDKAGKLDDYTRITNAKKVNDVITDTLIGREDIESIYIFSSTSNSLIVGYPSIYLTNVKYDLPTERKVAVANGEGRPIWLDVDPAGLVIPCGRAINDLQDLKVTGYFLLNLRESSLYDIYKKIKFYDAGELFIVNSDGRIISHANKKLLGTVPDYPYMGQVLKGGERGFFISCYRKKTYYITYCTIDQTGWKIVSVIPSIHYEKEIISLRDRIYLIALAIFLLAVLCSFFLSDSVTKPIRKLSQIMKKVGKGDFEVRSGYRSKDEIGILSENFDMMVERINTLIYKVYEEELLKQRSELKFLKLQINPHFLYNTLDTINWAARFHGMPDVAKLAKALGDMMREAINGEDFILLEKEIQNINNYLTIQKYRYADRFTVRIEIKPEAYSVRIPKLTLQPLIENSIVHGIEMKVGPGMILIEGDIHNDTLLLTVTDNGTGIPPPFSFSTTRRFLKNIIWHPRQRMMI